MTPNLFDYATSELSQDAFLCWLLSWADPEFATYASLHQVATELLLSIHKLTGAPMPTRLESLEIRRQFANIDILCVINGEHVIMIEDKVGTKQHSDQLPRYLASVSNALGFTPASVLPVYVQTGDQSNYAEVTTNGFFVLTRTRLLEVLESQAAVEARKRSDILDAFSRHLRRVEDDVLSFGCLPVTNWPSNAWRGFYARIQNALGQGEWDYVANASGGFLGFWWHFTNANDCEIYLQLEEEKFCFKICVDAPEERSRLRNHWHKLILDQSSMRGLSAKRPARFGNGQYMTVAVLERDYRAITDAGLLDLDATIEVLQAAQSVLNDCMARWESNLLSNPTTRED